MVGIVVVNFNGKDYLEDCLEEIFPQTYKQFRTVLVDNGSRDGSVAFVRKHFPQVKIIENKENLGFAKGNNIGINYLLEKYPDIEFIALVNNDVYLEPSWLENILRVMEKDQKIGSCVGKLLLAKEPGLFDSAGVALKGPSRFVNRGLRDKDVGQYDKEEEIFVCGAAAVVYRREMLEAVKLDGEYFDNDFFAYYEDVDLGIRARLLGFISIYTPSAVAYHHFAATSKKMTPGFREYHSKRNRLWVILKNYPKSMFTGALLSLLRPAGDGLVPQSCKSLYFNTWIHIKAYISALLFSKKMIRKRRLIQEQRKVSIKDLEEWLKNFQYQS